MDHGVALATGGVGVGVGLLLRLKLWNDAKKEVARLKAEGRLEEEVASVLQQMAKQEGREGRRQVQAEQILKTSVDDDADGAAGGSESKGGGAAGGEEAGVGKGEDGESGSGSSKAAEAPKRNRPVRVE
ncbi:unnamed protein product [Closterium sp. NIES-64]|nr:unnamed protein product [Closterium sp. NIES-64]CAI6001085.1 unnamed protein product [Closterium sp. NIES-64]